MIEIKHTKQISFTFSQLNRISYPPTKKLEFHQIMDTWVSTSYRVSAKAQVFLDYVSLQIDRVSGLPFVSRLYPNKYKELADIMEGDVVYYLNDVYFSRCYEIEDQKAALNKALSCEKHFALRLLSLNKFSEKRVPRIEQLIITDEKVDLILDTYATSLSTCVASISCKLFSSICGSNLLAINDEIVVNKTPESILLLLQETMSPMILLIGCPYQQSAITRVEIMDYMTHNGYATINPFSFKDNDRLPRDVTSLYRSESFKERMSESFTMQKNYTQRPYAVDAYMFPQSQGYAILEKQWLQANKQRWERNEYAWRDFLRRINGVQSLSFGWTRQSGNPWNMGIAGDSRRRRTLRRLVREGIPYELRPSVWFYLSGGSELKKRSMNSYQQLWQSQNDVKVRSLIEQDIPRTLPTHPLFSSSVKCSESVDKQGTEEEEEAPFVSALRHMLQAISVMRDDIQYCQGMNVLAGFLLVVIMEEEKAFWVMAAVLQYVLPVGYFDATLSGARVDEAVFERMVETQFPTLYMRLMGADRKLLSLSLWWFMNLFIKVLPMISVARVWDVVIMEGNKCLLRLAMALLAMNEKDLLAVEDDALLAMRFQQLGVLQFDMDALFAAAFRQRNVFLGEKMLFPYSREQLQRLREEKLVEMGGVKRGQSIGQVVIDSDDD